ncbi:MAG: alpha-ribazole transporter [Bacillota bacterium]|nr:alpha-ribazole transporter [Bacillota bacterium]
MMVRPVYRAQASGLRRLVRTGLLVGLSITGSLIKIPSLLGTPAMDSLPGYFAAAAFSVPEGAVVAALGHLATAASAGFPLGLPVHLIVAGLMAGAAAIFGFVARGGRVVPAAVLAVAANGIAAPAALSLLPGFGAGFLVAVMPSLLLAAGVNVGLASLLYLGYRRKPWV